MVLIYELGNLVNFFSGSGEMADTLDLGSSAARRESSTLSSRTIF